MIPFLVVIRSGKKVQFALTQRRNLKIGVDENSDVIVNLGQLLEHPQFLGPGSTPVTPGQQDVGRGAILFPAYAFRRDGISIRMIDLKRFFLLLLLACLAIVSLAAYSNDIYIPNANQDWTPIKLPAKGVYGFCRQDRNHQEGARFSFKAKQSQSYLLTFLSGGEGNGSKIKLLLNGTSVNKPMILPVGWGEERSIHLPAAGIINGENIIEVRPMRKTTGLPSWGISDLTVVAVDRPNYVEMNKKIPEAEQILAALEEKNIAGRELALYYETVSSWTASNPGGNHIVEKEKILNMIETRMKDQLHRVAFDVRTKNIQGDRSEAQEILNETSNWIPEDWLDGWEIFNEFCL